MSTEQQPPAGPPQSAAGPQPPGVRPSRPAGPPPYPTAPPPGWQPFPVPPVRQPGFFKRGFGLGLGASLGAGIGLSVVGIGSIVVLVALLAGLVSGGGGTGDSEPVTETVWGETTAGARLLSVPITGVILGDESDGATFGGATYGYEVADVIDGLDAEDADGLVLELNTPGGTIYGSRAIADAVQRYQERTGHQVLAHVQGLSASGGVYAMAGADQIVADHGSMVGSIGVIMGPFQRFRDVTGIPGSLLEPGVETEGGITEEYLSRGRGKDLGNPYRDMTDEERAVLGAGLDSEYAEFVAWVSEARGIPAETVVDQLGAYLFDGRTAVQLGLVDDVMGREEAYRYAATLNDLDPDDTRVDRVSGPGLLEALLAARSPAEGGAASALEPGRSTVCTGAPLVLAHHGGLQAACSGS
ncbi:S49 family peptidase [Blastococcus sp. SYSU D01042]